MIVTVLYPTGDNHKFIMDSISPGIYKFRNGLVLLPAGSKIFLEGADFIIEKSIVIDGITFNLISDKGNNREKV